MFFLMKSIRWEADKGQEEKFSSKIGFEVTLDQPYFHVPASSGSLLEGSTMSSGPASLGGLFS